MYLWNAKDIKTEEGKIILLTLTERPNGTCVSLKKLWTGAILALLHGCYC